MKQVTKRIKAKLAHGYSQERINRHFTLVGGADQGNLPETPKDPAQIQVTLGHCPKQTLAQTARKGKSHYRAS